MSKQIFFFIQITIFVITSYSIHYTKLYEEKVLFGKEKNLFGKEKNPSNILPAKYTLDSKIKFRCHPGVSCFTECCGNIKIVLTPYDILQIRKRLDMEAADFLHTYTEPTYLEKTDFPGVVIKLTEERNNFV